MRPLLAVSTLACLLAVPGAAAQPEQASGLIRIFATNQGRASLDLGRPGRSAGDLEVRGMILHDRRGNTLGYATSICTQFGRTLPSPVAHCAMTFVLPRGKITTDGTRHRRDYYNLAITGGTGIYSQARGVLIASTVRAHTPRIERILLSVEG